MSLRDIIGNEEIIFVGPKELKDYFFECRKEDPFLNFKYFSLDELIKNLFGSYLNKEVIKLGLQTFENYTYSLVKEVSKENELIGVYHTKGFCTFAFFKWFGGVNKNRPNENDLATLDLFIDNRIK